MSRLIRILIALTIIFLISFTTYFYFTNYYKSFEYNEFRVYKTTSNVYNVEIYYKNDPMPHYLSSRYNPKDLEYIPIEKGIKSRVLRDEIYITLDKELTSTSVVAMAEIAKVTGNQFLYNVPTQGAVTYVTQLNPYKTCKDTDTSTTVIWLRLGNETKVNFENECVVVQGTSEDEIIKAGTRLTLTMLEIMKD